MKNAVVIILSILLVAALVATGVLYSKSGRHTTLLAEKDENISRLQKESSKIRSDAEELQKKLERCERLLGQEQARPDLETDFNQALKEKEEAIQALDEKETAIRGLEQKLQDMENFIDGLQGKLSSSMSCINTLQSDVADYKEEVALLTRETIKGRIDKLEAEVVKFQGELLETLQKTTSRSVIEDLKNEIRKRQAEIDGLKEEKSPRDTDQVAELENRIAECQAMVNRLQEESAQVDIAGLKETIKAIRAELNALKQVGTKGRIKDVEVKIAHCRQELEKFKRAGYTTQIANLGNMINSCRDNLAALQGRGDAGKIKQLEIEIASCRRELDSLVGKELSPPRQDLEAELAHYRDALKSRSEADGARIKELEGRIASYQNDLEKAEKEGPGTIDQNLIKSLKGKIDVCRTELAGLREEKSGLDAEACQAEITQLKRTLESFQEAFPEARIAFLESEIKRYQDQLEAATQNDAQSQMTGLKEKISVCRTELDELRGKQEEVRGYKAEIDQLKQKLDAIEKEHPAARIASLETEIQRYKDQLDTAIKNGSQALIENLNGKISDCRSELDDLRGKQADAMGLEAEIAELKEKLEAAQKNRSDARIAVLESEIERLEDQLKRAEQDGSASLIESLNQKIAGCRSELEGLRLLQHKKAETDDLQARMAEMKRELDMLRQTCPPESRMTMLENEIARLKEELGRTRETGPAPLIENLEKKIVQCQAELDVLREGEKSGGGPVVVTSGLKGRDILKLEEQLAALKKQKAQVMESIQQLRSARESLSKQLGKQMQDNSVTITSWPSHNNFSVDVVNRILFESGQATITTQGRDVLTKVGAALKGLHDKHILVVGHTDDVPISEEYRYRFDSNWELSAARAVAVTRFFQDECGLSPDKLEAVAKSYYDPRSSNDTELGRAQNRRVEIIIGSVRF